MTVLLEILATALQRFREQPWGCWMNLHRPYVVRESKDGKMYGRCLYCLRRTSGFD